MTLAEYRDLRAAIQARGYGSEIEWAESVTPPETATALFFEYGWVVVNSGMKNQIAEKIWERILVALRDGEPIATAFGHPGKVAAMQEAWDEREARFGEYLCASAAGMVFDFIDALPWIGKITRWHLAKNLGVECAKPDRWLERVASKSAETVDSLCARLASESGDRIATVDLVIWRACNLGLWSGSERPPAEPALV